MTEPRRVLVVDDVEGWREQLQELLQDAGFEVTTAADRLSALSVLDDGAFEVAVVDVNLDDSAHNLEGLLINQHVQRLGLGTRVILISARALAAHELEDIRPATFLPKSVIVRRGEALVEAVEAGQEEAPGTEAGGSPSWQSGS